MSTHWGYKCLDCGVSSDHYLNHGESTLQQVYHLGVSLHEARQKCPLIDIRVLGADFEDVDPIDFLAEHQGHVIVLENEYGDFKKIPSEKT